MVKYTDSQLSSSNVVSFWVGVYELVILSRNPLANVSSDEISLLKLFSKCLTISWFLSSGRGKQDIVSSRCRNQCWNRVFCSIISGHTNMKSWCHLTRCILWCPRSDEKPAKNASFPSWDLSSQISVRRPIHDFRNDYFLQTCLVKFSVLRWTNAFRLQ